MADGYDDLTDEEKKLLEESGDVLPPADDDDKPADKEPSDPAAEQDADAAAAADPAADPAAEDKDLAEFLERHKDKSPEDLAKLLYAQDKRAKQAGFAARNSQKAVDDMRTAARQLIEQRRTAVADRKTEFAKKLEEDPDAATRMLAERAFEADEQALADEEAQLAQGERFDKAIAFAGQYIPDFAKTAPDMQAFGMEMGYSAEEVANIDDGRNLVMLYLGSLAGRLMKAGIIDLRGNVLKTEPVNEQPSDPRLKAPAAPANAGSGGGAPAGATTTEKRLAAMLQMSDDELAKLSDEELLKIAV